MVETTVVNTLPRGIAVPGTGVQLLEDDKLVVLVSCQPEKLVGQVICTYPDVSGRIRTVGNGCAPAKQVIAAKAKTRGAQQNRDFANCG